MWENMETWKPKRGGGEVGHRGRGPTERENRKREKLKMQVLPRRRCYSERVCVCSLPRGMGVSLVLPEGGRDV